MKSKYAGLSIALLILSGCSTLMGGLRSDFNDQHSYDQEPTTGGRYAAGGLLDSEGSRNPAREGYYPGHREQSASPGRMGGEGSWLTSANEEKQRQFNTRSMTDENGNPIPSYASSPSMPPQSKRKYKNGNRATKADFIDDARDDGSLWTSDGQTNYYLTKNKVRGEGDLIAIISDEDIVKDVAAELKRTLTPDEREQELELAQESLRRKVLGLPQDPLQQYMSPSGDQVASNNAAAARSPASDGKEKVSESDVEIPRLQWSDIDLKQNIDMKAGDTMMAEVIERFPNGNVKVRGLKKIRYRNSTRLVSVVGIARGSDITDDDKLEAGKLYEYRLESVR